MCDISVLASLIVRLFNSPPRLHLLFTHTILPLHTRAVNLARADDMPLYLSRGHAKPLRPRFDSNVHVIVESVTSRNTSAKRHRHSHSTVHNPPSRTYILRSRLRYCRYSTCNNSSRTSALTAAALHSTPANTTLPPVQFLFFYYTAPFPTESHTLSSLISICEPLIHAISNTYPPSMLLSHKTLRAIRISRNNNIPQVQITYLF